MEALGMVVGGCGTESAALGFLFTLDHFFEALSSRSAVVPLLLLPCI